MMTWFWQGILRFGSPLLMLTVVACGGSGSRQLVLTPPTPSTTNLPALPDQVSQSNLDALVDSLPDSLFLDEPLEIPTQSFLFPAGLFSLTITITDPDGEELVLVLTPELLGCNATATVCTIPATSLVLPELTLGTYSLSFEAIDQNGIPYGADKDIEAQEQEMEATPRPAPFNPNPGPLPDPAGTPTPSPSPGGSPTPTPEPSPTADPGAEPVAGFDSQPVRRSTINVGSALIGQESFTSLTMIEIGNAPLQVEASITGREASDFQIEPESFLIPDGGANQVATITCTPSGIGSRAATLTLTTNDPARPTINYPLICEGLAVPVSMFGSDPAPGSTIDLGSSTLNTATGSQTLKISNTGSAKLEVGSAQLTGTNPDDFTISPDTAFDIEASGSDVEVTITCTPSDLGTRTATLEFTTNDPNKTTVSYDLMCEGIRSDRVNTINDDDPTGTKLATCTLREAIEAVNATADNNIFGGCEITNSTISFANSLLNQTITVQNSVLPTIQANVTIQGLGKEALVISGNNEFRVFNINAGAAAVTIENLTLTQGAIPGNGGAILSSGTGLLTIDSVTISNSTATGTGRGGGIFATNLKLNNSTLSGNQAGSRGGGIYNQGITQITHSVLDENGANSYGGGIYNAANASLNIRESTLSGNEAGTRGGGIYNDSYATLEIISSTLSGNSSSNSGGGIHNFQGTTSIANSTLSGNTANNYGGGIYHDLGTTTITNSTLSGNSSGYGGGLCSLNSPTSVINSLVSGNIGPIGPEIRSNDTITFAANNLVGQNGTSGVSIMTVDGAFTIPSQPTNSIIAPLANNGGPTQTHALVSGSPALGAGDQDICDLPPISGKDQRGEMRPQGDAVCDIGAFESDLL